MQAIACHSFHELTLRCEPSNQENSKVPNVLVDDDTTTTGTILSK